MNITVTAGPFTMALAAVTAAISPKAKNPIYSCVRIDGSIGEKLHLTGASMDLEIRRTCAAVISEGDTICVHAGRLLTWAKSLASGATIDIATEDGFITAKSGRSRLKLQTLDALDFPMMKMPTDDVRFNFNGDLLNEILGTMVPFVADDVIVKAQLSGVHIMAREALIIEACEGAHMLRYHLDPQPGVRDLPENGLLIPMTTCRAIRDLGGVLTIKATASLLEISGEIGSICSKLIDAIFPDLDRIIPAEPGPSVTFESSAMLGALIRVSAARDDDDKSSRVLLVGADDTISIETGGKANGASSANDQIEARCEAPFRLALNGRHLADQLKALGGETVDLYPGPENAPMYVLRVPGADEKMVVCGKLRG